MAPSAPDGRARDPLVLVHGRLTPGFRAFDHHTHRDEGPGRVPGFVVFEAER